jgi:Cys-tRNA(Pro)/Cys-tRNA(Cys) deacylase
VCPVAGHLSDCDGARCLVLRRVIPSAGRGEHSGNGYDRPVSARATPAIELVRRAGVEHAVHEYELPERHGREREERPSYGLEAAGALGIAPERMFKTLVASADDRLVMAVVPVDRELDLKRLAVAMDARRAVLADPAAAERATGMVVGGIGPLGSRRPIPLLVDSTALVHETVFVSAGRRGLQLELAPADLVRLGNGRSAPLARDQGPG